MLIANPIYDVVFNYLMEDLSVAKYLIGHIINKNIIHLEPSPTVTSFKTKQTMRVFRLDYAATIKTAEDKTYKVIIEIQKALIIEDVLRFRRYLAKQYSSYVIKKVRDRRVPKEPKKNKKGKVVKKTNKIKYRKEEKKITYPIISIYFLGNKLENLTQPVVKIKRHYYDVATNKEIHKKEPFVERLTHDSYVIQIPYLPKEKRTALEHILAVFDQHYVIDANHPRVLDLPDKAASDIWQKLIRRLEKAHVDEKFEEIMRVEDEYYDLQQAIEKEREKVKKAEERAEKEKHDKERLMKILKKAGINY